MNLDEVITWAHQQQVYLSRHKFNEVDNEFANCDMRVKVFQDGAVIYLYWQGRILYRYNDGREGKIFLPPLTEEAINDLDEFLASYANSVAEFLNYVVDFLSIHNIHNSSC